LNEQTQNKKETVLLLKNSIWKRKESVWNEVQALCGVDNNSQKKSENYFGQNGVWISDL